MEEYKELTDLVTEYWNSRAKDFSNFRKDEYHSVQFDKWKKELQIKLGSTNGAKILDVGCGTGFLSAILAEMGFEVTGVDLSEEMITQAKAFVASEGKHVDFRQMNALKLDFATSSFDFVLSRNLTWTLPNLKQAYQEWLRVLRPGGKIINFDAEYAKHAEDNLYSAENMAHKDISRELKDDCNEIYHMLTISSLDRPQWDSEVLKQIGFASIETDLDFGDRIFREHDQFYIPDKIFSIKAIKN